MMPWQSSDQMPLHSTGGLIARTHQVGADVVRGVRLSQGRPNRRHDETGGLRLGENP